MADSRGVRSSSRRITPAPQLPPKATTRRRGASRDVDEPTKPPRRSARQASVDSVLSENEPDGRVLSRAKRKAHKEAIADLTVVEEVDAPASPPPPNTQVAVPRRSLGAASEMSGTTAISSFALVEAETLEPRFMLRHLLRLHEDVGEFLDHLVPAEGGMLEDVERIELVHDSLSDFFADYNDFDRQLRTRLVHYRGDDQQYIYIRAVHAALFRGANQDAATETGLDLLLYQTNLIVLAKDMIPLHANDKTTVGALRDLDNLFPSLFLPALILGTNAAESVAGDSALLQETFELALELRTQLAISSLSHGLTDETFDPDAALDEVFCHPQSENSPQLGIFRGWTTFALGGDGDGDGSTLPEAFVQEVVARITAIRRFFSTGQTSQGQEEEESVNMDDLRAAFPWAALMLRLVGWVRARNKELVAAIQHQGGARGILEMVKAERAQSIAMAGTGRVVSRTSPRKSRSSFGRNRRRSSGRFDPNAKVDAEVLSKLIAREGAHAQSPTALAASSTLQGSNEEEVEPMAAEDGQEVGSRQQDVGSQPHQDDEDDGTTNAVEQVVENMTAEDVVAKPVEEIPNHTPPVQESEIPESSRPPQSTHEFVSLLKETRTSDKENRGTSSLFQRQANAQRVPFGDGFDDYQPTPGPSRSQPSVGASRKGKEPQRPSPKKRKISEISDDDNDDDAFETPHRSRNVQQRRANAPKRVRIEPNSSGAPTSHQPRPRYDNDEFRPIEEFPRPEIEEPSETEAPEMSEEAPPRSTFDDIRALARANTIHKQRRTNRMWTVAEEEALISYMSDCPRQYSRILANDKTNPRKYFHALQNGQWIAQRSQVDLKDKARVMAKNMIKAGAGLRPGFEGVITPAMEKQLRDDGFNW
ncbi:hypothetical protein P171DRAFT_413183 [Karstenula rhodostoma CBS 690.94]|uniref:Myb-like domain-containing protein n=1 Tax=Karstenula rhodostoma CBS 690.94 TaxID=1392251 RepID=A0A9P4PJC7_9PLEO|nr:hypothetical protein P171DRAFT_413183 [Karstenula rhodostoma CBS 690.94]